MQSPSGLQAKLASVWRLLDERTRRLMAANEARAWGRGGISEVSRACGLSRKAIARGIKEIESGTALSQGRVRQPGAGRKKITDHDPQLVGALERLIDPDTRGDPETPLRWTCKSTRILAAQLTRQRHPISHMKIAQLLHMQGYSLQGNRKMEEGIDHPDRDAQFRHINAQVKRTLAKGAPVISVDTKKKELVGNYANAGQQWLPEKKPVKVQGHDFPGPDVPRAYPYGIYDIDRNRGFVNVGTDRKSTRLNSSHRTISYAVFCLKKNNKHGAAHRLGVGADFVEVHELAREAHAVLGPQLAHDGDVFVRALAALLERHADRLELLL